MIRLFTLLFCLSLTNILPAQDETNSFPASWEGIYAGTLEIFGPAGLAQSLPMELHILPIENSDNYTWTIIYGEDKEVGARNYLLEPTDPATGLYTIDEQNSIRIEGYLRGALFTQVFTVMESQIITLTKKTEEGLLWEIIANSTTPVSITGDTLHEGEEIPAVETFPVNAYQRAELRRVGSRE